MFKAGDTNRTADQLFAHLEALKTKGIDLAKLDVWGWDDGSIIISDVENLYDGGPNYDFDPMPYEERKY